MPRPYETVPSLGFRETLPKRAKSVKLGPRGVAAQGARQGLRAQATLLFASGALRESPSVPRMERDPFFGAAHGASLRAQSAVMARHSRLLRFAACAARKGRAPLVFRSRARSESSSAVSGDGAAFPLTALRCVRGSERGVPRVRAVSAVPRLLRFAACAARKGRDGCVARSGADERVPPQTLSGGGGVKRSSPSGPERPRAPARVPWPRRAVSHSGRRRRRSRARRTRFCRRCAGGSCK